MPDLTAALALKARLPRTWPAFFERHGNFTAAQLAALPVGLSGANMMLCAPTASGKTEAALAPLIERLPDLPRGLVILYLTPTRALVSDLAARLAYPMERLHLLLAVKTHDLITFDPKRPANVLLTTPESLDSLLASHARVLIHVQAVVIDELHLFDGTPRGDHLRVLLNRLRALRSYAVTQGDVTSARIQYTALSATLPDAQRVAARYFDQARVITVAGARPLDAELIALDAEEPGALRDYLATFQARGWRKALVFCNTRAEVEYYANAVRKRSLFGDAVYVHYSNIAPERRREIEHLFARSVAAICFASSTLELGIDIGSIDVIGLIGPPGNSGSFTQRLGRGNRRHNRIQAALFYRTALERDLFEALLTDTLDNARDTDLDESLFRPSVAIQQIFSLLKQSPTGAVRLPELLSLFTPMLNSDALSAILGTLQGADYLTNGRPGEWRAGDRLRRLIDQQASTFVSLSLYSNIQSSDKFQFNVVDRLSGQQLARADATWLNRPTLILEGRPIDIQWVEGDAIWIVTAPDSGANVPPPHDAYQTTRQLLSLELAQRLGAQGELRSEARLVKTIEGWLLYHFLGDLYGRALFDLLRGYVSIESTEQPGLSLLFAERPITLPTFTETQIIQYLERHVRQLEGLLALGAFEHLLPLPLRRQAVIDQFRVSRFLRSYSTLRVICEQFA